MTEEAADLIARALAGPLTAAEYDRLDALMAADPALRREFEQQLDMDARLAAAAATGVSMETAAPSLVLLQSPARKSSASAAPHRHPARLLPWLAVAAALAILGGWWMRDRAPTVVVHAPDGFTTAPLLTWENSADPAQKYDVWILPAGADQATTTPLFKGEDLRSPVAFSALRPTSQAGAQPALNPGGKYELLVCLADTGRMTGTMQSFTIAPTAKPLPATPAEAFLLLQRLRGANDDDSFRRLLQSLPPDWRTLPEIKALEVLLPPGNR